MKRLARFVIRRRAAVIAFYAVLLPVALLLAGSVLPLLKAGGFEDPGRESWQAFETLQREFGAGTGDIIALYTVEQGSATDVAATAAITGVISRLQDDPGVGAVQSVYNTGALHFVSDDGTRTFLLVDLLGDEQQKTETYLRLRSAFDAGNLTVQLAGMIPTNFSVFETIRTDLIRAELLAFPLAAIVVFLIFRSPIAVVALLAAGGSAIVFAFAALRAIVEFTDISIFAVNTIMLLGLGLAVDYSLFLVNRYREELPGRGVDDAIQCMLETTGKTIAFSGLAIAASLCGLFVFEQVVLRSLAIGGIVVAIGIVVLALTLVPAILAVIGERIDAWQLPFLSPRSGADIESNLWHRTAVAVMQRPLVTAALIVTLLLTLALPFLRFSGTIVDWRALPAGEPVRVTHETLDAEFVSNQGTPHLLLLTMPGQSSAIDHLGQLAALTERVAAVPGISRVNSVFTFVPDLSIAEAARILQDGEMHSPQLAALFDAFVNGPRMRLSLISEYSFDDPRSLQQVAALRALSSDDVQLQVAGYAAAVVDLKAAILERTPWMIGIVIAVMFVILFLAFGSITLPVKAIVMNSLSLTASFGAIVWIFQDARLQELLNYTPLGFSDATMPLVIFAVVFGLSMDYEIFLLSRVREEFARCGDNARAVAVGLARSGRLITSAGALFLVVVVAFATSKMLFMKALGVGMALAILLDITIVRALLVPATMQLLGRWNWYAPAALGRLWSRSRFGAATGRH